MQLRDIKPGAKLIELGRDMITIYHNPKCTKGRCIAPREWNGGVLCLI